MRLRARLACLILVFQLIPIVLMGLFSVDYIVKVMIDDLSRSADLMTQQIFEEMRVALTTNAAAPTLALNKSDSLRRLLDSTQAFGPAVVSASIVGNDGKIVVSAHGDSEGRPAPALPPISELEGRASKWMLFANLPTLVAPTVYEARRPVELNGHPLATISIGVTTALIADSTRNLLVIVLTVAAVLTLGAWLVISPVANRILIQVTAIAQGFERLAAGSEQVQLKVEGEDELSTLATKFNELSRQVRADRSRLETDRSHLFDVVRSIQDAVALLDSSGAILFANKQARARLAAEGATMEGAQLKSLLGEDHPLVRLVDSTMTTGIEAHDVPVELPGSSSFLVSFFRLGSGRLPAGLLMVLRDLEPVIELETALDYSNRLARLGALISGMAHQLRSPLHGMNLRLELLRQDPGEKTERHINKLRMEVNRLDESVEALLRFMRPQDLKLNDFDANELLNELGSRVKNDKVNVEYQLSEEMPLVRADRGMVAEALSNLITNAVQAMPDGGVLTMSSSANGSTVTVKVTDQGVGIAKDNLKQIFDLYYTTKPGGNGLGLPFAMRAIELNRGKIEIQSRLNEGTVCSVSLPVADNAATRQAATSAA